MELSYTNKDLLTINKRLFLLVALISIVATFAVWQFPLLFVGLLSTIVFVSCVYNLPELGVGILLNGLNFIGYFVQNIPTSHLVIPAIVLLYSPALMHYVANYKLRWKFGLLPWLVLFIGVLMFIGIVYSPMPREGLTKAGKYLATNIFIFYATMLFIDDIDRLKNVLKIAFFIGFITSTVSVIYIVYSGTSGIFRFALPSQNPIWFARDLGISLLATLGLFEISKKKLERSIYIFFMLVVLFLIYIAGSRGPFFALLISLFFYFFLLQRKGYGFFKKSFFVLLTLFALKVSIAFAPEHIWKRMLNPFQGFDLTTFYRLRAFETAKDLFLANPLKGVGTAGFGHFNVLSYPHNIVLELASELGIGGVLAFVGLVFCTGYLGFKLLRNKKASFLESNLNKTFFAIFIFTLINAQFSGAIYGNYQLWFAIAGIWTLYCSQSKCLRAR